MKSLAAECNNFSQRMTSELTAKYNKKQTLSQITWLINATNSVKRMTAELTAKYNKKQPLSQITWLINATNSVKE